MGKPRGRPFPAGNTFGRGRPRGSKNRTTPVGERLLRENSGALWLKCIFMAMNGDMPAMRVCMQHMPGPKPKRLRVRVPDSQNPATLLEALETIVRAVIEGKMTPEEAKKLAEVIGEQRKVIEEVAFDKRLRDLEQNDH